MEKQPRGCGRRDTGGRRPGDSRPGLWAVGAGVTRRLHPRQATRARAWTFSRAHDGQEQDPSARRLRLDEQRSASPKRPSAGTTRRDSKRAAAGHGGGTPSRAGGQAPQTTHGRCHRGGMLKRPGPETGCGPVAAGLGSGEQPAPTDGPASFQAVRKMSGIGRDCCIT